MEKANSPEARAAQEKARQEAFLRSLDGAKFVWINESVGQAKWAEIREVQGNTLISKERLLWATPANLRGWQSMGFKPNRIGEEIQLDCDGSWLEAGVDVRFQWKNGQFICGDYVASFSSDGQSLTARRKNSGGEGQRYQRQ
jgi:hypothetical protein